MSRLTRQSTRIGMGYEIHVLHIVLMNGIPLTTTQVWVTIEPSAGTFTGVVELGPTVFGLFPY